MNCRYDDDDDNDDNDDDDNDNDFDDKEESDSEVVEAAEATDTHEDSEPKHSSNNSVTKLNRDHLFEVHTLKWLSSLHSGYRLRPTRGWIKYLAEHIVCVCFCLLYTSPSPRD